MSRVPLTAEQMRNALGAADEITAEQMRDRRVDSAGRLAFETHTINQALERDLVLYGSVTATSTLVFTWRAASGIIGERFDDRQLAIDWMADWLGTRSLVRSRRSRRASARP